MSRRRAMRALLLVALCVTVFAAPATAGAGDIILQDASTSNFPDVTLDVVLSADLVPPQGKPQFTVLENGIEAREMKATSAAENREPIDVVLLIDTSGSMKGDPLANAKAAAIEFVEAMRSSDRVAVVAFSSEPREVVDFTSDRAVLEAGIGSLATKGYTALYDGLIQSTRMFEDSSRGRFIVVLSDGNDSSSINQLDATAQTVAGAEIPVYAVALSSPDYDPKALEVLAKESGGKLIAADKAEQLTSVFKDIAAELSNRFTVTYVSARPATKDLEIELRVTNGDADGGLVTAIANPVHASGVLADVGLVEVAEGSPVLEVLTALLYGLALGGVVYAAGLMLSRGNSVAERLESYGGDDARSGHSGPVAASRSRILEAVAVVAERRGFTGMVKTSLERADLPLRPNEYIFLHLLVTSVAGFAVQLVSGRLLLSSLVVVLFAVAPIVYLTIKIERRRAAFEEQLPDVLGLIAGSLRAGWGIQQAIELVVEEIADPAASEFRRVQSEARFGLPLEQALGRMAERLESEDFRWAVTAITIQREVGGNLAEVLDVVATSIRERAELRRHVSALTAESRFSMIVLTILPIFLLGALFVVNPAYAMLMTSTRIGMAALFFGFILLVIGVVWINRLTKVEV